MGQILQQWRIPASILFSVAIVAGAYMLARSVESPDFAQASTESALLQAIATKDFDGDGLPDWEEVLYATDTSSIDTFHLGMTDGEAVARGLIVPRAISDIAIATSSQTTGSGGIDYAAIGIPAPTEGSLTDVFAKKFFELYLSAKQANSGRDLTGDQTSDLAGQAMTQLSQTVAPTADFKKMADMKVSGTGARAMRTYAAAAEAVLVKNKSDATMSEIGYLQSALDDKNASAPTHLAALAKTYRDSAAGLAALPVPQELAADHLAIVNSIMRLGEIDGDFARVNVDPLSAMLALQQFTPTELAAERAFISLANTYATEGIILRASEPGAMFVNLMTNIAAAQRAAAKKQ